MIKSINALVLFTSRLDACVQFYRSLGVELESESHDDGPVHLAANLGDMHFAIYETTESGDARPRRSPGSAQIGFQVDHLEDLVARAARAGGRVLVPPEVVPWGRRAVLADPDGRAIELNGPEVTEAKIPPGS